MEDESFFVMALGGSPLIRVLDFLMENRIFDYSKTDLAREIGISRATLDSFWRNLVELEIVKQTRVIGRATLYKLNVDCDSVRKMIEFDLALSKSHAEKIIGKKRINALA